MQPSELELYSTQELIDELMRRQTFLGVVIHAEQELKTHTWGDERIFKVHFNNNLDAAQTGRLLDSVANYIDANLCEE